MDGLMLPVYVVMVVMEGWWSWGGPVATERAVHIWAPFLRGTYGCFYLGNNG